MCNFAKKSCPIDSILYFPDFKNSVVTGLPLGSLTYPYAKLFPNAKLYSPRRMKPTTSSSRQIASRPIRALWLQTIM